MTASLSTFMLRSAGRPLISIVAGIETIGKSGIRNLSSDRA
jgi:hypothetical protein